jgi:hypothetical protein
VETPDTALPIVGPQSLLEPSNKQWCIVINVPNELGTLMAEDVKHLENVDIFSLFKILPI